MMLDKRTNLPQYKLYRTCRCVQNTDPARIFPATSLVERDQHGDNGEIRKIKCQRGYCVISKRGYSGSLCLVASSSTGVFKLEFSKFYFLHFHSVSRVVIHEMSC